MKLLITSDLHIEFHRDAGLSVAKELTKNNRDCTLVLAGDIGLFDQLEALTNFLGFMCAHFNNVIYIPGNHEFVNTPLSVGYEDIIPEIKRCIPGNNLYSTEGTVVIEGHTFHLGTGWYPEPPAGDIRDLFYLSMFDGRYIPPAHNATGNQKYDWPQTLKEIDSVYRNTLDYLSLAVKPNDIIISHHLPSTKCISKNYIGDPLNPFFVSGDMEKIIHNNQPRLFVHGHTHDPIDMAIDQTQIICNPLGYPGTSSQWDSSLIVEI